MTTLLWRKEDTTIDARVQQYLAGDDVILDRHLLSYDIEATIAHVRGLASIRAISESESRALVAELHELADQFKRGEFVLDDRFEDGHSAIESFLTERLGDIGKKVHLGRSRNDQVLVAQRLFVRDKLCDIRLHTIRSARTCLELATREATTPIPGYTHLQRAVPSSVGLWMAGFAEAFVDDAVLIDLTQHWLSANPLGTAAGFGVNVPLARDQTTMILGFDRMLINPMYAQNSRGKCEFQALSACWQIMQDIRRLAWDLSLYATAEFGFVQMSGSVTTGSSIMPNKRNPDLVELLRAAAGPVAACLAELQQTLSLPSGYHRDLQLTKGPVIRGLNHTLRTVELLPALLESITFNRETMMQAIDSAMYATDHAVELARSGLPFRDAYRQAAQDLEGGLAQQDPAQSIEARVSPGGCGDLRLAELTARLAALEDPE